MNDPTILMIIMLVVVALMMSRDTHKLFAETTRTWAQFGSSNYKAISALTTFAMLAIGTGVWKNQQDIKDIKDIQDNKQYIADTSKRIGQEMDAKIEARQEAALGIQQAWKGHSRYLANREKARQQNMESARKVAKNQQELEKFEAQRMQAQRELRDNPQPSILDKLFSLYDYGG